MFMLSLFSWIYIFHVIQKNALLAAQVSRIYIKDNVVPIKLSALQLVCEVTSYVGNVRIFKEDSSVLPDTASSVNSCTSSRCLFISSEGADYTVQGNNITISISSLQRTRDQKYWFCEDKFVFVQVYTQVSRIYIKDNVVPIKLSALQLVCEVTSYVGNVRIFKEDSSVLPDTASSVNSCTSSRCLFISSEGADYTVQGNNITISISSLQRTRDQKYWFCEDKFVFVQVYTVPASLTLEGDTSGGDLQNEDVTLLCKTSNCVFPAPPQFQWFWKKTNTQWLTYQNITPVDSENSCSDNEKIYSATLSMPRYTVWPLQPSNIESTVKFQCRLDFPTLQSALQSSESGNVLYGVLAGKPSLTNWTSGNPEFLTGVEVTLNCESTPTRPAVSVVWKKGTSTLSTVHNSESTNPAGLVTVTSTVTFTPQKADDGLSVSCETSIPNQNRQISQRTIAVWWLPSTPFIPTNTFPWLEGQNGKQLKCESSDYGNPVSDAMWVSSAGTPATRILNLPKLEQEYDGMSVTCQLKNSYTEKLNSIVKSQIVQLDVQYKPDIFIYINGVEKYSHEINEGENLTVVCSAKGNPVPSVTWQGQTTGNTQLVFTDIDRKDHGSYRCDATASSSHYPTYDFSNETTLHISVRYISVTSFYVEGHEGQNYTTVDEHDTGVKLSCTVNAYSAATIQLNFEGDILKEEFEAKSLSFSRSNVDCFHAGIYTCQGGNNDGQQDSKNVTLFVRCTPRPIQQIRQNTTSQLYVPVTLSFTTIAYPEPGPKGFSWYKENGKRWMALLTNEDIYISSSGLQSNLTFRNVSPVDYGEYRVTVTNSIGTYDQVLFLSKDSTNTDNEKEKSDNKTLIVGLILGCVCIILAIYATYITIRLKRMITHQGVISSSDTKKRALMSTWLTKQVPKNYRERNIAKTTLIIQTKRVFQHSIQI